MSFISESLFNELQACRLKCIALRFSNMQCKSEPVVENDDVDDSADLYETAVYFKEILEKDIQQLQRERVKLEVTVCTTTD